MNICPLCGNKSIKSVNSIDFDATMIDCDICGRFMIEKDALDTIMKGINDRSNIFFYLCSNKDTDILYHFHMNSTWENGIVSGQKRYTINIRSLNPLYPVSFSDKINKTLLNLGYLVKYIGGNFQTYDDNSALYPIFNIDESYKPDSYHSQFEGMMSILKDSGYIKHIRSLGDNQNLYTITANGWEILNNLQINRTFSKTAFIAMWFNETMVTAREKIIEAISTCGYIPVIIDAKEHNNQIVPEIFYEINQCKFMVADLTGQRSGVYYEAGYGEALNKQVILMCRESDFGSRHFDVAQKNTIVWKDEEDLLQRLKSRIIATVGVQSC